MAAFTRREFGQVVIASLPLAAGLRATPLFGMDSALTLGVSTASFNDLARVPGRDNVDDVIRALKNVRATHIELALGNVEPPAPNTGPTKGGSAAYPTLIADAAADCVDHRRIPSRRRSWRLQTNTGFSDQVRQKFEDARITVHACALEYNDRSPTTIDATPGRSRRSWRRHREFADDAGDGAAAGAVRGASWRLGRHPQPGGRQSRRRHRHGA